MSSPILSHLREVAPDTADISILQPADPFLETAGEDLRRRIFITETVAGVTQCLRPEFTIPICLAHIENADKPARYSYAGTVFRQEREGAVEFQQIGLEDLGNTNAAEADAASIVDMAKLLELSKCATPKITVGDQNLFNIVVENLGLPRSVSARFIRAFGNDDLIKTLIQNLVVGAPQTTGEDVADKLAAKGDVDMLQSYIEEKMQTAKLSPKAGRSAEDIARRMIDRATERGFRLVPERAELLREFLALATPLSKANETLGKFAKKAELDFGDARQLFVERAHHLQSRKLDLDSITYSAAFGRNLEYYTGLLFEAEAGGHTVAGGGRYDGLCTLLGAENSVPAVGFSISLDRLAEATT